MRVIVADDDPECLHGLATTLSRWGYQVQTAKDGLSAWELLRAGDAPRAALLGWRLPGADGPDLCRRVRALPPHRFVYLILLTAQSRQERVSEGLRAGADDYLTRPFDREELYARLQVASRVLRLQQSLADQVRELGEALGRVRHLQGLLPICCYCKSVRNDQHYWQAVEHYLAAHADVRFSHGICPACYKAVVEPQLQALRPASRESCTAT